MDYRFSFTDLFTREVDFDKDNQVKVSSIVIPQIQRPYAQGRTDGVCTYIRNMFLDEIFENLTSGNDDIFDLNFIYGIIKPNNNEYRMELLDGQQRLTTLFLLYWYITNAELDINQPESKFIRDCLSKFLYETRTTSTVFCQELSSYKVELGNKTPKEVIRNSNGISNHLIVIVQSVQCLRCSMLYMIDIHSRNKEVFSQNFRSSNST